MGSIRSKVLGVLLVAATAASAAETDGPPSRSGGAATQRTHSARVRMHAVPLGVSLPSEKKEEKLSAPAALSLDHGAAMQDLPALPPPPSGPRRTAEEMKKAREEKNWMATAVLEASRRLFDSESAAADEPKTPAEPTGWGWLADDVLTRIADESQAAPPGDENEESPGPRLTDAARTPTGLMMNDIFAQTTAALARRETGDRDPMARTDEDVESRAAAADGPRSQESPAGPIDLHRARGGRPDGESLRRPEEGMRDSPRSDEARRMADRRDKPHSLMPRTEALMARSLATEPPPAPNRDSVSIGDRSTVGLLPAEPRAAFAPPGLTDTPGAGSARSPFSSPSAQGSGLLPDRSGGAMFGSPFSPSPAAAPAPSAFRAAEPSRLVEPPRAFGSGQPMPIISPWAAPLSESR